MTERYLQHHSHSLGRTIDMLAFGHSGIPVVLFPTSMGKYYQNKDFKMLEAASWFIDQGLVRIYCPDSVDSESWYNRAAHPAERVRRHQQYDAYLRYELMPFIYSECGQQRAIFAGASFGAYHAMNFAFRYPYMASHVLNMGGAYDIRMQLRGYYDDNCYYNNPPDFIPNLNDANIYNLSVVLGVGDMDFCLGANQRMSQILSAKGISHWLDIRAGATHDWPIWRDMFPHYLSEVLKNK
jgi:esterase/lipase superfamily enzyme